MTNRDLLKEAIADAKAVKETAIANAKAALEESFTPHLKSMLAAKLEEMDNDGDIEETITTEEVESVDEVIEEVEDVKNVEEEINLDEILAELEESEEVTEAEEDEDVEDVEDEEAEEATEEEEIDLEDMSEDDLKSFIEDVIKDMVDAGELEGGEEMESEEEAEGAEIEDEMDIEIEDDAEEIMENEELDEYGSTRMKEPSDSAAAGLENIISGLKALVKKGGEIGKKAYAALEDLGAAAGSAMRNEEELEEDDAVSKKLKDGASLDSAPRKVGQTTVQEEEIDETLSEIEDLKKELQEVNLLNAKLLYTNKIFKAKNLSEDKKVKVLKAFDKAETVKEAKVIFETLNEGMVSKTSTNSMVNEVKGSASKAMGISQTTKQPIVENDAFARMQKLAGIIK